MNTLTKSFAKRALSILLVTIMVFSLGIVGITTTSAAEVEMAETGAFPSGELLYLDPGDPWNKDGAGFAAYFFKGTSSTKWVRMTQIQYNTNNTTVNYTGDYYVEVPSGTWDNVIFVRLNSSSAALGWNSKWDQTNDLSYDSSKGNCYQITAHGSNGGKASGEWLTDDYNSNIWIRGDFTAASDWDSYMMEPYEQNMYEYKITLAKGYHNFEIYRDGEKQGQDVQKTVYECHEGYGLWSANDAAGFKFFAEGGTYTFKYNRYLNKITIENDTTDYNSSVHLNHNLSGEWKTDTEGFNQEGSVYTYDLQVEGSGSFECDFILNKDSSSNSVTLLNRDVDNAVVLDTAFAVDGYGGNIELTYNQSGTYTFTVDLSQKTATVSFEQEFALVEVVAIANPSTISVGDTLKITPSVVTSADNYTADYELYQSPDGTAAGGTLVSDSLTGSNFEISTNTFEPGTYYYYVVAKVSVAGVTDTYTSKIITVTVNEAQAFEFTVTAADQSVYAGQTATITATTNLSGKVVTYQLHYGSEHKTNTTGVFDVETTEADAGKTLEYTIKAFSTDDKGNDVEAETTVKIKVVSTGDEGEMVVTIYFKCAESYGYIPSIKFGDGNYAEMQKAGVVIGHNNTNTGHYWWYKASTVVAGGEPLTFALNSERFFKDCTYTLDITKETPEVSGIYDYYFGIDNLNLKNSEVVNLTGKEYKNNFNTIIDMIVETSAAELAETGVTFNYYAVGDANSDGKLNVRDATIIQKDLANITELSEVGTLVADVNGDGRVTIKDATAIQKQLAGL